MPQYNLTGPEQEIVVSWLFEQVGYLDVAVNNLSVSARQALVATPTLDVTVWIRTNSNQAIEPFSQTRIGPTAQMVLQTTPVVSAVVTINGVLQTENVNYTLDYAIGLISFVITTQIDDVILVEGTYRHFYSDQRDWDATGMVWWIWKRNGVNVTPPQRPPESALWIGILEEWAASIDDAFIRVNSVARNASTVPITAEDGTVTTMPAGTQLIHQRSMFDKVMGVLS